ncbi:MAG: hypothetical protein SH859_14720 [Hyphomicrobium aestuarii]|nr:hypothetical protein [Hyphomicrobium aestuarii]
MARDPFSVFINAPFDEQYRPIFEAMVFTISACGYRPRCALEEDNSDIRMDKLHRLIKDSGHSLHDLSRTDVKLGELPRFNMPFELGMVIGLKRFGAKSLRGHGVKIMVAEPYKLPAYLSDLGGNDPVAHHNEPEKVIGIVCTYLQKSPDGVILAGPKRYATAYNDFGRKLPLIAEGIGFEPEEVNAFANYPTFCHCVAEYLENPTATEAAR